MKVTGLDKVIINLSKLGPEISRQGTAALYAAGQEIEIAAEISITDGSVSGKGHVPSLLGEPPNADTRLLDTSIDTTIEAPGRVNVTSNAPYSAHLEFGTSRMAERPFMRPALEKKRERANELVKYAAELAMKGANNG